MAKLFCSIGTGPGIGLQTALRFAKEGFVPLLAARSSEKLAALAQIIRERTSVEAQTYVLDAKDNAKICALLKTHRADLEVLHYNAASLRPQYIHEATPESIANDIQVDLTGAVVAINAILPFMQKRRSGTILLTGGGFALAPSSQFLTLSLGKAGLRALSAALFADLAKDNVHIASVTVKKAVEASANDPEQIAEIFFKLYKQPRSAWTYEEFYG